MDREVPSSKWYSYTTTPRRLRDYHGKGYRKMARPRGPGICCETVSSRNDREASHDTSAIGLPKQDLRKHATNRHVNMKGENVTPPETKNCKQLRNASSGRSSLPWRGAPNCLTGMKGSALTAYT